MAVFDELNRDSRRYEEPEIRSAGELKREGKAKKLKRRSSGVTVKTYRASLLTIYWILGLGFAAGLAYVVYLGVTAFIGS